MRLSDFRSDTVTRPTPQMREAMASAEVGDDVFGEDPTVARLEAEAARRVGHEAGLFVPSGTMANQIGVRAFTAPGDEILAEARSHVLNCEAGAIGLISGVQCRPLEGRRGLLDPTDVERAIRPADIHAPRTALLCLENSHNFGGGTILPVALLDELCAVARRHGVPVLLDGARLFNAAVGAGVDPAEWGRRVDLVWFALSKGLSAPVGSVLCGPRDRIEVCRRVRKQLGGGMRQAGVLAAAGLVALEHQVERLADDHRRARRLAEGLAALAGFEVAPGEVETNIVLARRPGHDARACAERLKEHGVLAIAIADDVVRFVTHREVEDKDVDRALDACQGLAA